MEMYSLGHVEDQKPETDTVQAICRCCLSTDKRMYDVYRFSSHFMDLAGISVSDTNGLPPWVCSECSALLLKSVSFKHKLLRAHTMLYDYLTRCAPFPLDAQDPELSQYVTPQLTLSSTLVCDTLGRGRHGYHKVLEHEKKAPKSELCAIDLPEMPMFLAPPVLPAPHDLLAPAPVPAAPPALALDAQESVKDERGLSDYDDDIPLYEYKSSIDKITEEALDRLLEDSGQLEMKQELPEVKTKKKKKKSDKDKEKTKRNKKKSSSENGTGSQHIEPKPSIRKPLEIDPTKIKIITLNPEEQIKQREEESRTEGYLRLRYKCDLCFKGFNFESKLVNHMKKHCPSRGKYACKLCHVHLPTPYSYNVHMLIHTRRYECLKCGRRMIDRASIVEHYRNQHEGIYNQYTCHLCGKLSNNNKTHRGHMRNHHSAPRARCALCDKTFVNQDSLAEHMLIHSGTKNYECEKCGQKFRTRTQVKHHQLKHSDVKEFYCVECDVRFKSAHNLRQHLLKSLKHKDINSFKFACSRCEKRCVSAAALAAHVAVRHEATRAHACVCGARLASRGSLRKHQRAHAAAPAVREKRHVCHKCGRAFASNSVLQNHVRTHTGERPHACALCSRRFTQRAALATHHKLVHLRIKRTDKIKPLSPVKSEECPTISPQPEAIKPDPPLYDEWRQTQPLMYYTSETYNNQPLKE